MCKGLMAIAKVNVEFGDGIKWSNGNHDSHFTYDADLCLCLSTVSCLFIEVKVNNTVYSKFLIIMLNSL